MTRPIVVVKVGGSLFGLPDLRSRLAAVVGLRSSHRIGFVSGGGASADVVRQLQPVHDLSDAAAHRVAMQSLSVGESLLLELIDQATSVNSHAEARKAWRNQLIAVFSAARFVQAEHTANPLPLQETWATTSDSIAAWIATVVHAEEIVMLKSAAARTWSQSLEHVDPCFEQHARSVPLVSWGNLRETTELVSLRE